MLSAELTAHLGYEDGKDAPPSQPNRHKGTSTKRLKGQDGEVPISVPRDGAASPEGSARAIRVAPPATTKDAS